MERFRVVLTCWDFDVPKPYADAFSRLFVSQEGAERAVSAAVKDELETLNDGREKVPVEDSDGNVVCYDYDFRSDENGNHVNIVRFWDGDDYKNVTAYDIHKLVCDAQCVEDCSYFKYRGFFVLPNKDHSRFVIEQHDTSLASMKTLSEALDWIDDFHLAFDRERGSVVRPAPVVKQEERSVNNIFINKLDGLKLSHKEFVDFVFDEAKRQFDDCHDNEKWEDLSAAEKELIFHEQYEHQLRDRDWEEKSLASLDAQINQCTAPANVRDPGACCADRGER